MKPYIIANRPVATGMLQHLLLWTTPHNHSQMTVFTNVNPQSLDSVPITTSMKQILSNTNQSLNSHSCLHQCGETNPAQAVRKVQHLSLELRHTLLSDSTHYKCHKAQDLVTFHPTSRSLSYWSTYGNAIGIWANRITSSYSVHASIWKPPVLEG